MILNMTVGIVDLFLVGHLGKDALAAVGVNRVFMGFIFAFIVWAGTGARVLVAHAAGAKNFKAVESAAKNALLVGTVLGILLTVVGTAFSGPLCAIFGLTGQALQYAREYMFIIFLGCVSNFILIVLESTAGGLGNTKTPFQIKLMMNILNILLSWTLIFGIEGVVPAMEVRGAALGTVISRFLTLGVAFWLMKRHHPELNLLPGPGFKPDRATLKRVVQIGLNTTVHRCSFAGSRMFMMWLVGLAARPDASIALAGYAIATQLLSLSFMPTWGLGQAAGNFVGQNLGASNPERAWKGSVLSLKAATVYMVCIGFVLYFGAETLMGVFANRRPGADAVAVVATGAVFLKLLAAVRPFAGFNICLSQVLIGAGDTRTSMLINLIGKWFVIAPAGLYVAQRYGLQGVWYVFIAGIVIDGTAHFIAWMRRRWLKIRFAEQPSSAS